MSASSAEIGAADGLTHLTGHVSSRCHDAGCGLVRGLSGAHSAGGASVPPVLFRDSEIGPSAGARVQSAVSKRGEAPAADLAQRSPIRPAGATIPAGGNGAPDWQRWTAEQIERAKALRREGFTAATIAGFLTPEFGIPRSADGVAHMFKNLRRNGQLEPSPVARVAIREAGHDRRLLERAANMSRRRCLMCGEDFPSEGPGNRVCDDCKRLESWRAGA